MPICTAVLAAALLSSPTGAPADQVPAAKQPAMSPAKQFAAFAAQHPDQPDMVADRAMDVLKNKGTKVGPMSEERGPEPRTRDDKSRDTTSRDDKSRGAKGSDAKSRDAQAWDEQNGNDLADVDEEFGPRAGAEPQDVFLTGGNQGAVQPVKGRGQAQAPAQGRGQVSGQGQAPGSQFTMPAFGRQFANSGSFPMIKQRPQAAAGKNQKDKEADDWDFDWS